MNKIQSLKIKDLPEIERPREKLEKTNIKFLTNTELLSILLGSGIRGKNVKKIAESLLKKFGNNLINTKLQDLIKIKGIGKVRAEQIIAAFELAKRLILKDQSNITIKNSEDIFNLYTQEEVYIDKTKKKYKDPFFDFKDVKQTDGIHGLHIYPAVMAYPIADYLIENYSKENNIVLDPFMGSGTTLVEANIKKRYSYGIDINPLAELITKVKLTPLDPLILRNELEHILKEMETLKPDIPEIKNINLWFKDYVIEELGKIKKAIWQIKDNDVKDFFKISFSETIRSVSNCRNGFKLHRYSEEDLKKHNPNVKEYFYKKSLENIYKLSSVKNKISKKHWFKIVKHISEIKYNEIDLIVTSPPYGDSKTTVAYGQFSRFSLEWLELNKINVDRESLGGKIIKNPVYDIYSETLFSTLEKISNKDRKRADEVFAFFYDLNIYLKEFARVVKPGGFMCIVVGNRTVKNVQIPTDEIIVELCRNNFIHHKTIIREILNKRMPNKNSPTNIVGDTVNTMLEEYIIILERK